MKPKAPLEVMKDQIRYERAIIKVAENHVNKKKPLKKEILKESCGEYKALIHSIIETIKKWVERQKKNEE